MKQETFVFHALPKNVYELMAIPEAALTTPFMTAAVTVAALCAYGENPAACIEMLNALKGPQPLSNHDIQFMRDRMAGKPYKPFSYFAGATPKNGYVPDVPYTITVFDGVASYPEEGHVSLYIKSGGADTPRPLSMRLKPSTGQWFLTQQSLLGDIRIPEAEDPWA